MEEKKKEKGKRGGYRKGGGRPRLYKVQLCVYLSQEVADDVKAKAKAEKLKVSEYVEKKLKE